MGTSTLDPRVAPATSTAVKEPAVKEPKAVSERQIGVEGANPSYSVFQRIVTTVELGIDAVGALTGVLLAYCIYTRLSLGTRTVYPLHELLVGALVVAGVFVAMMDRSGAYTGSSSLMHIRETERVLRASGESLLLIVLADVAVDLELPRWVLVIAWVSIIVVTLAAKHALYAIVEVLHGRGVGVHRAIIYGSGQLGRKVVSALVRSRKLGIQPVAVIAEDVGEYAPGDQMYEAGYQRRRSVPVIAGPISKSLLRAHRADHVIVAVPTLAAEDFNPIAVQVRAAKATLSFAPQRFPACSNHPLLFTEIDGVTLAFFSLPKPSLRFMILKRATDIVLSALVLFCALPLFAAIALAITATSRGPVFFRQTRVGKDGETFSILKFRTMYTDAPKYSVSPLGSDDARITPAGRWLRRTSLDELPQLVNVLRGEMSLVGPRPEMPFIVENYSPLHRQRLTIRPGITGLWQLSADRAYAIHENIEYDLYYIRHCNYLMDISILLHTVAFAMRGV